MRKIAVAMVLTALVGASCTSVPLTSPRGTGTTSTSATSSTTRPPHALDDLSAFFTAASDTDHKLKVAAIDANGAIGTTEITINRSVLDAIGAADPTQAARDIPAGLPPDVLLRVLTVQSDLESRYYAFRGFVQAQPGSIPRTTSLSGSLSASDYLLRCLGGATKAANSFSTDLAAARTAASHAKPVAPVDPGSQTAANLAIWLRQNLEANSGCDSCGGVRTTSVDPITWHHVAPLTPGGTAWDGDVGGLLFAAQYTPALGWTVQLNAC